jgi:hypothetical protein
MAKNTTIAKAKEHTSAKAKEHTSAKAKEHTSAKAKELIEVPDPNLLYEQWEKDISSLVETYKDFDSRDKKELNNAKKDISNITKQITTTAKNTRDIFTNINRKIRDKELEFLAPITPIQERIKLIHKEVLEEEKREARVQVLPLRLEELLQVGVEESEELVNNLLDMEDADYRAFLFDKQDEFLKAKQEAMEQEQEKMRQEKNKMILEARLPVLEEYGVYIPEQELVKMTNDVFIATLKEKRRLKDERESEKLKEKIDESPAIDTIKAPQAVIPNQTKSQAFFDKYGVTKEMIQSGEYKLIAEPDGGYALYKKIDVLYK